jgi:pimeloyl-ACP methyl ester carboxylesterase
VLRSWIGKYVRAASFVIASAPIVRPHISYIRRKHAKAAIVFIHGFGGDITLTWGDFPRLLLEEPKLKEWDIVAVGYQTRLALDVRGVWEADADLETLARYLVTLSDAQLSRYERLALVAHSMGGLVLQRALVDSDEFARKAGFVFLFGTPSAGLRKAKFVKLLKRQTEDMGLGSPFISKLRSSWQERFGDHVPFHLEVIAGSEDVFVPSDSSLAPFDTTMQNVVPGNHTEIVKPRDQESLSFCVIVEAITRGSALEGPLSSARLAVERRRFNDAIQLLEPGKQGLDENGVIQLSLAYEGLNRHDDAIQLLESYYVNMGRGAASKTDAMGVLGGRLKRSWIRNRQAVDAERAYLFYDSALEMAVLRKDWDQAHYHSNNLAFLQLAYNKDEDGSKNQAFQTMKYCELAKDNWRVASMADSYLLYGESGKALLEYSKVVSLFKAPRDLASILTQATWICELRSDSTSAARLEGIFQSKGMDIIPLNKVGIF